MTRTLAAADIGSNTAHLLVAATDGGLVMRIDNLNEWIPLGEVVSAKKCIPKELIEQLVLAVSEFKRVALLKRAERLYVFATEGMRMAENHSAVLHRIFKETGVQVEIISPATEAAYSLRGVLLDTKHLGIDLLFEVGGGSAQIAIIHDNVLQNSMSLPLGTGRIIAESRIQSPCPDDVFKVAELYIANILASAPLKAKANVAVASGGVGRGLWRALHPDGEKVISIEELDYLVWSARRLSPDRIMSRFGVKAKRAATLLPGALVYQSLMNRFGLNEIVISEFGVREGALLELYENKVKACPA